MVSECAASRCLQEDCDMEYFGIDIAAIHTRCKEVGLQHVRFPVRDFDPFDLRLKLPKAVARLAKAHNPRHDVIYIHCTAGTYWQLYFDCLYHIGKSRIPG
jgi:hypothetical protein